MSRREFKPKDYLPVKKWVGGECERRSQKPDDKEAFCRAYDDLADFLGNYDGDDRRLCVCLTPSGHDMHVPVTYWRRPVPERRRAANGEIACEGAWGNGWKGQLLILAELRLDGSRYDQVDGGQVTKPETARMQVGAPPQWDWERGISAVWAAFYSGEEDPPKGRGAQAAIVRLLQKKMQRADGETPSDTETKKRAAMIVKHLQTE
jgi:hypothetical protein